MNVARYMCPILLGSIFFASSVDVLPTVSTEAHALGPPGRDSSEAHREWSETHRRQIDSAKDLLAAPSVEGNIQAFLKSTYMDETYLPYVRESIKEMNIAPGTRAYEITYDQAARFLGMVREKRMISVMSSQGHEEAVRKGLSPRLADAFNLCKHRLHRDRYPVSEYEAVKEYAGEMSRCVSDEKGKEFWREMKVGLLESALYLSVFMAIGWWLIKDNLSSPYRPPRKDI